MSLTTTSSGAQQMTSRYNLFGSVRSSSGGSVSDYRFTGQRQESLGNNWIYDYNGRFYNALIGRFLSADTIVPNAGNPQVLNRYSYVLNDPLKYTDPTGHCPARDDECWELQRETQEAYGIIIDGEWSKSQISALQDALSSMSGKIGMNTFKQLFDKTRVIQTSQEGSGDGSGAIVNQV